MPQLERENTQDMGDYTAKKPFKVWVLGVPFSASVRGHPHIEIG
jgi:hypothetical protein